MNKSIALLLVLVLAASSIIIVLPVRSEARTIVVPDDYPTIGIAIENASEGDTVYVKIGMYEETTLTINKSISLIGEDTANTILNLNPPFGKIAYFTLSGPEYGYYEVMNILSDNVTISGFTIVCNTSRIFVAGNGTQITNNNLATGIVFYPGNHRSLIGNVIKGSINSGSDDTIIANNTLVSLFSFGSNVRLEKNVVINDDFSNNLVFGFDSNHWVEGNIISGLYCGMGMRGYGNTVFNNTIINTEFALRIQSCWMGPAENRIFHNNFINNTCQVDISPSLPTTGANPFVALWDQGYEVGGNYWSDYLSKYPNATEIGSSGFGDTPYVIDAYNKDNYPLMRPVDVDFGLIGTLPHSTSPVTDSVPPQISVLSPIAKTYNETRVSLVFTLDEAVNWTGYSLDGKDNVTITGNRTITGFSDGMHNVTVYANDTFGNMAASETVYFSVEVPEVPEPQPEPESFPVIPVATASVAAVAVVGVGLLVYFKKRKY